MTPQAMHRFSRLLDQEAKHRRNEEAQTANAIMKAFPELTRSQAMREACRIVDRETWAPWIGREEF